MTKQHARHAQRVSGLRGESEKLSLVTPWPQSRRVNLTVALVAVVGFTYLLLPRSGGWVGDHLHKEDGTIFLTQQLHGGLSPLLTIYSGYTHVGPRLVVAACATATTSHFPACVATATDGLRVVMMVLAFPLLAAYARTWRWGLAGAALFLFLPAGQWEVLGNVTNLRWFLVPMAVLILLSAYDSVILVVLASLFVVVAALSDPLAAVLLPLAVWRFITVKGISRLPAACFLPASILELSLIHPGQRGQGLGPQELLRYPIDSVEQLLVRGFDASQFGITGTEIIFRVGGLLGALVAVIVPVAMLVVAIRAGWNPSLRLASVLIIIGSILFLGTIMWNNVSNLGFAHWYDLGNLVNRYSVGVGLLIGPALLLACSTLWDDRRFHRMLAAGSVAVLALACVADFKGDKYSTRGPVWSNTVAAARHTCTTSHARNVTVTITPTGVGTHWTANVPCSWIEGG